MHVGNRKTMTNIKKILKPHTHYNWPYNWPYNRLIIASILVSIALLGDRRLVILINWRLNCGRSILNLFDYMKAAESPGDGHHPAISRSAIGPSGYGH